MAKALVFKTGKWNNKPFDLERVKKIFGSVNEKVKGIYAHTSHWNKLEKDPLELAEFSNFEIDSEGKVYADLEFNEKGLIYKQDNAIKGISVELDLENDILKRIALLPIGVKAAVMGAEFEELEEDLINFELIEKEFEGGQGMTYEELKAAVEAATLEDRLKLIKDIGLSIPEEQKKAFSAIRWEFEEKTAEVVKEFAEFAGVEIELKEKPVEKTPEEIRAEAKAEAKAEFELEKLAEKRKTDKELFLANNKTKISPALAPIVEYAYEKALEEQETIVEFSETEKIPMKSKIENVVSNLTGVITKEITENSEFENETDEDRFVREAAEMGKNK